LDKTTDILDGIAALRVAFIKAELEPPKTILLNSNEQGVRFLMELRQSKFWVRHPLSKENGTPVEMADGSIYMEVDIMGVSVRWPANRYATSNGGWCYI
jgi:hypothetical protein